VRGWPIRPTIWPRRTQSPIQEHRERVEVAVEGVEGTAVAKNMLHNHYPFVPIPALWLGVHHPAMPNAVNWRAQIGPPGEAAPIFPGVEFVVAVAKDAKITPAPADVGRVWRVNRKVEDVYNAAGGGPLRYGQIGEQVGAGVAADADGQGGSAWAWGMG
jgi:hypothetical protein